ncbi:MAG: molybdenum cofactor guanylyltransferase [Deltaproteobacteria bacterium]|nr:molybdenum cofactor guanylyltransferase [Deltaproteobacteria bacterium]
MDEETKKERFTAVILAGGKSTRFSGKIKAKITIRGEPIIEHTIRTLRFIFNDILVITNNPSEFNEYKHIRMAGDIYHNIGPLGGLHSALHNTHKEAIFMVASDMPELSVDLINNQLLEYIDHECDVLIPEMQGRIEPLHGVYSRNLLPQLENYLQTNDKYAIRDFLQNQRVKYFSVKNIDKQNVFININSQEDLNRYFKL